MERRMRIAVIGLKNFVAWKGRTSAIADRHRCQLNQNLRDSLDRAVSERQTLEKDSREYFPLMNSKSPQGDVP